MPRSSTYGDVETAAGAAVIVAAGNPALVAGLVLVGPFVRQPASSTAFSRLFLRLLMMRPWAATGWKAHLRKMYARARPDAVDATRFLRASLHGFVALETGGAFEVPVDLERSFVRLVGSVVTTLAAWSRS